MAATVPLSQVLAGAIGEGLMQAIAFRLFLLLHCNQDCQSFSRQGERFSWCDRYRGPLCAAHVQDWQSSRAGGYCASCVTVPALGGCYRGEG